MTSETKTCTKCKTERPTSDFSPRPITAARDGLASWCKFCMRLANKKWKAANPDSPVLSKEYKTESSRQRRKDPDKVEKDNADQKRRYAELRIRVLTHYSGGVKPFCKCCGEDIIEFLALDHIDGGGKVERALVGVGFQYWRHIINGGFQAKYQVLCHNCNSAKGFYGVCPHEKRAQSLLAMARTEELSSE